jgi:hypothetical protein
MREDQNLFPHMEEFLLPVNEQLAVIFMSPLRDSLFHSNDNPEGVTYLCFGQDKD